MIFKNKLITIKEALYNRKTLTSKDIVDNNEYVNLIVKNNIGFINYSYNLLEENYTILGGFELIDNGSILYVNTEKILGNLKDSWLTFQINVDNIFYDNPVTGNRIKKVLIGNAGNINKALNINLTSNNRGVYPKLENITIEYETAVSDSRDSLITGVLDIGDNVGIINLTQVLPAYGSANGKNFHITNPNNFIMNKGFVSYVDQHINKKKILSLNPNVKFIDFDSNFKILLENNELLKLLLTSKTNIRDIWFGLPLTTDTIRDPQQPYVMIKVKDSTMESKITSNYLKYYKKVDIYKYIDPDNPRKTKNIEDKYGYFLYFSKPII